MEFCPVLWRVMSKPVPYKRFEFKENSFKFKIYGFAGRGVNVTPSRYNCTLISFVRMLLHIVCPQMSHNSILFMLIT